MVYGEFKRSAYSDVVYLIVVLGGMIDCLDVLNTTFEASTVLVYRLYAACDTLFIVLRAGDVSFRPFAV